MLVCVHHGWCTLCVYMCIRAGVPLCVYMCIRAGVPLCVYMCIRAGVHVVCQFHHLLVICVQGLHHGTVTYSIATVYFFWIVVEFFF